MRNRASGSEGEPSRRNGPPGSRFRRALKKHGKLAIAVLAVFVVLGILFGRRAVILPLLYRHNLRSHAYLSEMTSPQPGQKILIFSPHPDDETLGCGGLIQQAVQAGSDMKVVLMTNGEYPEIDVVFFEETVRFSKSAFVRLGEMRQRETLSALNHFGLHAQDVTFLGYPNRYLSDMWLPAHWQTSDPVRSIRTRSTRSPFPDSMTTNAIYCGQSVLQDVETVLLREKPDLVFTPHPNDVHPDHWPTYALVRFALEELAARGESFAKDCEAYTCLTHRDSWPTPRAYRPKMELEPPPALTMDGQTDWQALPLTGEQTLRKHEATGAYRTQAGAIDPLLRSFARRNELFGVVPVLTWQDEDLVPNRVVIVDPDADLVSSASYKSGDISLVSLGRNGDRLVAEVVTRGTALTNTGYHLSIHSGRSDPSDRVIAEYEWQGTDARGASFSGGRLQDIGDVHTSFEGKVSTLEAPWPFETGKQGFFMIRAWTTKGNRITDQTATGTYRMSK